jgi:hypothetical protein
VVCRIPWTLSACWKFFFPASIFSFVKQKAFLEVCPAFQRGVTFLLQPFLTPDSFLQKNFLFNNFRPTDLRFTSRAFGRGPNALGLDSPTRRVALQSIHSGY